MTAFPDAVPSEARFRALADAAPIGIFETDAEGNTLYTNPAWHQITQVTEAAAKGGGWKRMLHADDADDVLAGWQDTLANPHAYGRRFRIVVAGDERRVEARVAPTYVEGCLTGFVGTLVDVTPMAEAEESLAAARDRAVEASQLKSDFIANISHEIRTPLNGVLGLTQILSETDLDPKQQSYVDTIRRAGDDLLELLNNVLDLSKVEAGAMQAESVAFDAAALVRDTAQLFEPSARNRNLTLDLMVAESLAPLVAGDPTRLRQVLCNLISNAIKFTDHGGITVVAEQETEADGIVLRVSVTDTGIGIPAEVHADVFEPFAQGDSSTTRRFGGSGLGLSISKRIIEMMGGTLALQSAPGRGSTFTLRVPLGLAALPSAAASTCPKQTAAGSLRVLVVEDNAVNQLVIETMLRKLGHEVEIAENGEMAVAMARQQHHDLILMDCQMPIMDGYAATAAIRALAGEAARTPIVALTASAMPEDKQRCLDAGMDAYLAKPIKQPDLLVVVDGVVARTGIPDPR